ncbi:MAG: transporter substrate-binding domain-containing protein [Methanolinea sp.]|jgi:ABC-type amino acid transport substrate-binding protein|nr:transporter substrate-binding domain-containing protein [Methanolinea sp.]
MNHSSPWVLLALGSALLIILTTTTGCMGPSATPAPPCVENTTPETSPCLSENILFLTEDLYPFNYLEPDGTIHGESVEVVRELAKRLNCSVEIEVLPWNDAYLNALHNPGHAVFSAARTPEREAMFAWVGPIASFEYVLYARHDSGITLPSLEAARTAGSIAVVRGDAREEFLRSNHFSNVVAFSTDTECLEALMNRSVSLWMGSSSTTPDTLRRSGIPEGTAVPAYTLLKTELFIAFNKATATGTIRAYQDALNAMKADGTFARVTGKGTNTATLARPLENENGLPVDTVLSALSSLISARMHGIAAAMESLALTSDLQSGDWERIRPLLIRLEREYPEARFWFARPDGSYYTTVDNLTSANLKDRSYFPGVLAGETSVGTVVVSKSTGRYTAIIAVPVYHDSVVNGILGTSVYCDTLAEILAREFPLQDGYSFFILDREGMPVLDSIPDHIVSLDESALMQMRRMPEGRVDYRDEGTPSQAIFRTIDFTGWKVAIGWRV